MFKSSLSSSRARVFSPAKVATFAAVAAFALSGGALLHAQSGIVAAAQDAASTNLMQASSPQAFSSSSAGDDATAATTAQPTTMALNSAPLTFAGGQYGGGRRGGRPRYRGGNSNPDGSPKYDFEASVGFTAPVQDTSNYLKTSYGFGAGFGRNFNKHFGTLLQFDWDNFAFQGSTLQNQLNLYNYDVQQYNNTPAGIANPATPYTSLGGSSHVWSFTLDPVYNIRTGEGLGAYVVGGVGFYHKTANFTTPTTGYCYDYFYGYYQCSANATIDKYTSNAPGFNGGFGLTYKFSRFASEKLFGEIRYVYVANQNKAGITSGTVTSTNYTANNQYPANSHTTYYFPIKFGIRF